MLNRWGSKVRRALFAYPWCAPALIVVGAVVLANILYIAGIFHPNPLYQQSGLNNSIKSGLLPGLDNIDPNIGFTSQALGHLAATDWLHGTVPWWNPYEGLGAPLAGEMQSAALFPLVLIDYFSNGQVFFRLFLEMTAGLSMLFLLLRLVRTRAAATAGAVAFALNGTFSWMFHAPGNPLAFAPLLVLGIEQCRDRTRTGPLSGWPLVGVAMALSLYAGFPEMAFLDGLVALLWAAVRASELRGLDLARFARRLAAGAALGILLAAPVLVAFATYLPMADVGGHSGAYGRAFLPPSTFLPASVIPYLYGPILGWIQGSHSSTFIDFWGNVGGYIGASLMILALVSLCGTTYRRLRWALGLWVVLGVMRTAGVHWAMDIVNAIPGVSTTAFYRYAEGSWEFALVVLAALGIDDLVASRRWQTTVPTAALALLLIGLAARRGIQVLRLASDAPERYLWAGASIGWATAVVLGIAVTALLLRRRRSRAMVLAGVLLVDAMAMFVVPQLSAPRQASVDIGPVRYLQAHLGNYRYFALGAIQPNYGSYWNLSSANVNDLPIPKAYASYVSESLDTNVDPTVFTGTTEQDPNGPSPAKELLDHLSAYEAIGVKYVVMPSDQSLTTSPVPLPVMYRDKWVTIVALPHPSPLFSASGGSCSVLASSLSQVTVHCAGPGTLTRLELYMPGWSASVGGQPATVSEAKGLVQSVPLKPGTYQVSFTFGPPHMVWAMMAFALGLLILASAAAVRWTGLDLLRGRFRLAAPPPAGADSEDEAVTAPTP